MEYGTTILNVDICPEDMDIDDTMTPFTKPVTVTADVAVRITDI